jgi:hypothetical protein
MSPRSVTNAHILFSFQAKVCELKAAIEEQKQSEEKLAIKMSQKIQQREQELEEIKREMRFSLIPTAHDELREVDKGVVGTDAAGTDAVSKPARSVRNVTIYHDPVINNYQVWHRVLFSLFPRPCQLHPPALPITAAVLTGTKRYTLYIACNNTLNGLMCS